MVEVTQLLLALYFVIMCMWFSLLLVGAIGHYLICWLLPCCQCVLYFHYTIPNITSICKKHFLGGIGPHGAPLSGCLRELSFFGFLNTVCRELLSLLKCRSFLSIKFGHPAHFERAACQSPGRSWLIMAAGYGNRHYLTFTMLSMVQCVLYFHYTIPNITSICKKRFLGGRVHMGPHCLTTAAFLRVPSILSCL